MRKWEMSSRNLPSPVSAAMRNGMPPLRDAIFLRANGDRVAFSEYGDARGEPVIFCHGWPSSRTMAELTHDAARELGVRIISPDRPGIADSTFVADRRLLDWPPLLRELMDFLEIRRFRMLAISGGAPYAYATARAMPDSVAALAVVSGAPDIAGLNDRSGLFALYRLMLSAYRTLPHFSRWSFRLARPFLSLRPPRRTRPILLKLLQPCDAGALRDERAFEACFESQRRAWQASAEGVLVDAEIYAQPWGFSLNELRVPVRLWHGNADRSFSAAVARQMASQIPDCVTYFIDDAGHYSTPIRHMREIIADLLVA
jgi:pimeloyl-ACP methyl ester carboxylesterase